jgi:hypothetical protein
MELDSRFACSLYEAGKYVEAIQLFQGLFGHRVRISGFELWQIGMDGLIASSQGHFDTSEYQRQLEGGVQEAG